jgi:methionyl-tRNA formyltransferase
MGKKIIVFCNNQSIFTSNILLDKIIKEHNKNFEIVGVIDTNTNLNFKKNYFRTFLSLIKNIKLINPNKLHLLSLSIQSICKNHKLPFQNLINNDINSIDSIQLYKSFGENVNGIVIGCPRLFSKDVIKCFDKLINYHDSYLPAFKGLNATAWSRYEMKKYSGFTFHEIVEEIDSGEIVFKELLPINYSWNIHQNLYYKTLKASYSINKVLDYIVYNKKPIYNKDEPYTSKFNYYSQNRKNKLINMLNDENLNIKERSKIRKSFF